jgi:hypothetical protein
MCQVVARSDSQDDLIRISRYPFNSYKPTYSFNSYISIRTLNIYIYIYVYIYICTVKSYIYIYIYTTCQFLYISIYPLIYIRTVKSYIYDLSIPLYQYALSIMLIIVTAENTPESDSNFVTYVRCISDTRLDPMRSSLHGCEKVPALLLTLFPRIL